MNVSRFFESVKSSKKSFEKAWQRRRRESARKAILAEALEERRLLTGTLAPTIVSITASPSTAPYGTPITFSATLSGSGPTPTGTVTFSLGTPLGAYGGSVDATLVNGTATVVSSTIIPGDFPVAVFPYSGDSNYAPINNNLHQPPCSVDVTGTAVVLSANPTTANASSPVTFTATIDNAAYDDGSGSAPTGSVTFYDGSSIIDSASEPVTVVNGVATLVTSDLPAGDDTITADYGGDSGDAATNSSPLTEHVSSPLSAPTITISDTTNGMSVVAGTSVTLAVNVSGSGAKPTGAVTFYNGSTALGSAIQLDGSGDATLAISTLPVGTDSITAQYAGDSNYASGTSSVDSVTVTAAPTLLTPTLTLALSSPTIASGATETLTATVAGSGATPTGTVTFYTDSDPIGSPVMLTNGVASLPVNSESIGTHSIAFTYDGDTNYNNEASTSQTLTVVAGAMPTITLAASSDDIAAGQPLTFTANVASSSGPTPTGTVTFLDGGTQIDQAASVDASGAASVTTPDLSPGMHTITAQYSGDSVYSPATSTATTVTITDNVQVLLIAKNSNVHVGQFVAFDAIVTNNGTPASGLTVDFSEVGSADVFNSNVTDSAGITKVADKAGAPGIKEIVAQVTLSDGTVVTSNVVTVTVDGKLKAPKLKDLGAILTDPAPTFNWSPVDDATSYEIVVRDVTPGILPSVADAAEIDRTVTDNSFTIPNVVALNPEHRYIVKVRALNDDPNDSSEWSEHRFVITEQPTTMFRIRLDASAEITAGDVGKEFGLGSIKLQPGVSFAEFKFTIQAISDPFGDPVLGPPKFLYFRGLGVGLGISFKGKSLPGSWSGTSSWQDITTPTPMLLKDFASIGDIILAPGINIGTINYSFPTTLSFNFLTGSSFSVYISTDSAGIGVTIATAYPGEWHLGDYDPGVWPNTLSPSGV